MKKRVVQIVDSFQYVQSNCYQSQLLYEMRRQSELTLVEIGHVLAGSCASLLERADTIVSTLKLRVLEQNRYELGDALAGNKIVMYEQDPFENFRDDSPYKNAYDRIVDCIDVKLHVVTVKKYADRLNEKGFRTVFERIWMLPHLCRSVIPHDRRRTSIAFYGTMYPWRRRLMDDVKRLGINVSTASNSKSYKDYLNDLQDVKMFLCSHESGFTCDNVVDSERHGMYHKDVEVCSQGCFSLSDASSEMSSYVDEKMPAVLQYEHHDQIPDIVKSIEMKDPEERQSMIDRTVERIKELNWWDSTARTLIEG